MGPAAAALVGAGIQGGSSALGNLWASKERRIQTAWVNRQYEKELANNRQDATTAYNRQLDYKAQMDAYRKAGINPYMVASNGVQPQMSSSSKAQAPQQAQYHGFESMGQTIAALPMMVQQLALMVSQNQKTQADTANTNVKTQQETFNLTQDYQFKNLERLIGIDQTQQVISNLKSTKNQIDASVNLISKDITNKEIQNKILDIQSNYTEAQMQLSNAKTRSEINNNLASVNEKNASVNKMFQELQNLKQAYETGKITQDKLQAETNKVVEETYTEMQTREGKVDKGQRPQSVIEVPYKISQDIIKRMR
jgi:hypothetical protein